MLLSFVLRLVPDALASGQVVGQVEDVASGQKAVVRNVQELLQFIQRESPEQPRPAAVLRSITTKDSQ